MAAKDGIIVKVQVPAMSGYSTKRFDKNMTISQAIGLVNNTIPSSLRSDRYRLFCNSLRLLDEERTLGSYGVKDNVRQPIFPSAVWPFASSCPPHTVTLFELASQLLPLLLPFTALTIRHIFRIRLSSSAAGNSSYKTQTDPKRRYLSRAKRSR